ncbi:DUF4271 domain-containing protein [Cellulophaga baltica]|uniref:DUF4271 domain-containing protein n=1 Tax=Cellulophaga baltica TaxID=76594 RepID=A0A1G7H1M6_9FLAO|nr:DUF4271 domain-containing protein [Cellulophaga baltica]SDE94342.1 protein of unknown function [Cellulophaga baltica]
MKEVLLRSIENIDWITLILCCSITTLVLAKKIYYGRFVNFIILPFNNKYIFLYNKKDKLSHWFTIFLSIFQLLNFTLFLYFIDSVFKLSHHINTPFTYIITLGILITFFFSKLILHLCNAFVFNMQGAISEFLFKKISYFNYSSLIMFVANILLAYILKDSKIVIYITVLLIAVINILGWVTAIRNHQKLITNNFFYFILYLCALEIAPLVLLGDYFKD